MKNNGKILSFDIESCTGNHSDGSLCSFGYCMADENFNIIKQGDILVNPVPKEFKLGGNGKPEYIKLAYPESAFRSSPTFDKHYETIKSLFEEVDYAIGFSVVNDVKYLNSACDKYSLPHICYKFIDVQILIKNLLNQKTVVGLSTVCEHLGIDYVAHRSDEDARVTLLVLKALCVRENATLDEIMKSLCLRCGVNDLTQHTPMTKIKMKKRV